MSESDHAATDSVDESPHESQFRRRESSGVVAEAALIPGSVSIIAETPDGGRAAVCMGVRTFRDMAATARHAFPDTEHFIRHEPGGATVEAAFLSDGVYIVAPGPDLDPTLVRVTGETLFRIDDALPACDDTDPATLEENIAALAEFRGDDR